MYKPLPWQIDPWRDTSLIMLLTGSAGGGKSVLAAEKLHAYCLKYPGAMALAMRKSRQSMVNSTVLVLERKVLAKQGIRHLPSKYRFEYPNGSILAYGGMKDEEQREAIRSIGQEGGLDICWMEEANGFREEDFNEVLARMRGKAAPWRQVMLSTNPDSPTHWIYKRLIQGGEAKVYRSAASDNHHNAADYISSLARITGVQKTRLVAGQWVQAEGTIYPSYDPTVHVIEPEELPSIRRYWGSQDWGFTHAGVFQLWGSDNDGRAYRIKEIYRSQKLIGWWRDEVAAIFRDYTMEAIACDPSEPGFIAEYQQAGLPAIAAINDVLPGLQAVAQRMEVQPDEKPRLMLVRQNNTPDPVLVSKKRPTSTEEEIPGYVWKATKEEPVKEDDDGCDAMRYGITYADSPAPEMTTASIGFASSPFRLR